MARWISALKEITACGHARWEMPLVAQYQYVDASEAVHLDQPTKFESNAAAVVTKLSMRRCTATPALSGLAEEFLCGVLGSDTRLARVRERLRDLWRRGRCWDWLELEECRRRPPIFATRALTTGLG